MGNFKGLLDTVCDFVGKHSPEILTGLGITGTVIAVVSAAKATPKAMMLITEEEREQHVEELSKKDKFKTAWKCYIPAVLIEGASIACIIGASTINQRRNTALATAYTLSERAFKEYEHKVIDTIGEKKEQKIRDEISEDRLKKNPVQTSEVFITEKGNTLCYDTTSSRYFKCDIDRIRKVENEINRRLRDEMTVPLNDLYCELGLEETTIGRDLGWDIDRGYLDISFSTQLATNDEPCLVLNYEVVPIGFKY